MSLPPSAMLVQLASTVLEGALCVVRAGPWPSPARASAGRLRVPRQDPAMGGVVLPTAWPGFKPVGLKGVRALWVASYTLSQYASANRGSLSWCR